MESARANPFYLNRTLFKNHATSSHYLLISSSDMKIPSSILVSHEVRYMTAM